MKVIHLALDIAEGGKWPILYLYTDLKEDMQCIDRIMIEAWTWYQCETCCNYQGSQLKPKWHERQWLKYKYGEVWKIDSITLPQACQVIGPFSAPLDLENSIQLPFSHTIKAVKVTQINEKWILTKPHNLRGDGIRFDFSILQSSTTHNISCSERVLWPIVSKIMD